MKMKLKRMKVKILNKKEIPEISKEITENIFSEQNNKSIESENQKTSYCYINFILNSEKIEIQT